MYLSISRPVDYFQRAVSARDLGGGEMCRWLDRNKHLPGTKANTDFTLGSVKVRLIGVMRVIGVIGFVPAFPLRLF